MKGKSRPFQRIDLTATGEQRTVRVNGRAIAYEGRSTVLAAVFDMTDQLRMEEEVRRSREFLRSVLDHIPTAVFVKDMLDEGRYILCNKASEIVYGRPSADILGATDREILDREVAERIEKSDQEAMRPGSMAPWRTRR